MKNKIIAIISILIATSLSITYPVFAAQPIGIKVGDWSQYSINADVNLPMGDAVSYSGTVKGTISNISVTTKGVGYDGYDVTFSSIMTYSNGTVEQENSTYFLGKYTDPNDSTNWYYNSDGMVSIKGLKVGDKLSPTFKISQILSESYGGSTKNLAYATLCTSDIPSGMYSNMTAKIDTGTGWLVYQHMNTTMVISGNTYKMVFTASLLSNSWASSDILSQINDYLRPYTEPIGKTLLNLTNNMNISMITNMITFLFIDQPAIFVGGVGLVIILIAAVALRKKKPQQNP